MESQVVSFRLRSQLEKHLERRVEAGNTASEIARRDLERYYDMLWRNLPKFSENEALFLCDVLNGHINRPESASLLWAEVSDAIGEGVADKHDVNGPEFMNLLRGLTSFECMAIEDAVERFWMGSYTRSFHDTRDRLHEVGLVAQEK